MSAPARAEGRRIPVMGKSAKRMGDREASHSLFFETIFPWNLFFNKVNTLFVVKCLC